MSYTQGPWKVSKDGSVEGNDHTQVATFIDNSDDLALIAAAPELVEALERLTKEIEGLLGYAESTLRQVVGHTNVAVMKHHLQAATETLAKAKGGQP